MPEEKKLRKKRILRNKWQIGDMYIMPITGTYPRFPEMKVKYLLLIKIGDKKDLSGHIQPVVYIKYLDKEYNKEINIDELVFSPHYDYGYKFVICGIAGRAQPKQLTYVGNYKNVYSLKKPENDKEIEELCCNHECYVKSLEHTCIAGYLMYVLGIDGKKISKTIHMTEQEYNQYCIRQENTAREREEKKYRERKKKEFYICPWKDGDVFYLPIREETEDGIELIRRGFVGIVLMKIGIKEDYATTNQWPIVIMQCVKKNYNDVKDVLNEDVFSNKYSYKKQVITHKKFEKIPDELKWIGNIDDFNNIHILEKVELPFKWSEIEWYL